MSSRYYAYSMTKPPSPSDLADKFMLRLPDGMREQISTAAKKSGRSMNTEIVYRLAESLLSDRQSGTSTTPDISLVDAQAILQKITQTLDALDRANDDLEKRLAKMQKLQKKP